MNSIIRHFVAPLILLGATAHAADPSADRLERREFPSVFQAWNEAQTPRGESAEARLCRHDLLFTSIWEIGLAWDRNPSGLASGFTKESVRRAKEKRKDRLQRNPNLIVLAELRYRDAHESYLPADHPWWKRDAAGDRIVGWAEGGYYLLDFDNADYQRHLAAQAKAMLETGVVDGIMLDWWRDTDARIDLIKRIRSAIGNDALILVNANDRTTPRSAEFVNGLFLECYRSATPADWQRIEKTLTWAETNLRKPRINCLEVWHSGSRRDLAKMRATTTLALTASNGFVLFADPNELPTPDHLHDWYEFWDTPLGRPTARVRVREDGARERHFTGGVAVYNRPGNKPVTIDFDRPHRSIATGNTARSHTVPGADGDLFIPVSESPAKD